MKRFIILTVLFFFISVPVYGAGKAIGVSDPTKVCGAVSAKVAGVAVTPTGSCAYVHCNGFETQADDGDWFTVDGAGTPDYDNTTFSPEGSESMYLVGTNPGPAESAYIAVTARAETWITFQIRANDNNEGDEDVVYLYNGSTLLATLTCNSETDWSVTAEGGDESGEEDANINTSTWYIKLRFKQGTGANAEIEFWACTDGTTWAKNLSSTNGTSTAQVNKVVFQNTHDTEVMWIDNFMENSADIADAR